MITKQQTLIAFSLLLLSAPALQAAPSSAQYPKNPITNTHINCISSDHLNCYDANSQQRLWTNNNIQSARGMLIDGQQLIINSDNAAIILNLNTGKEITRFANTGTLFDPILAASRRLILSDQQGWIRVINLKTKTDL